MIHAVGRHVETETGVMGKTLRTMARSMESALHWRRTPARLAIAACVVIAALPALIAFSRDVDAASRTVETSVVVATPTAIQAPASSSAAHSLSMLMVGALLISAGSAIRRAA
jgi:hypothetical protein